MSILRTVVLGFSLSLSINAVAASEQNFKEIQALIVTEPEQGLAQAKQYWQGKAVSQENLKPGLLLVSAYMKNKQYEPAADLLERFMSIENLDPDSSGLLLARKLNQLRLSKSKLGTNHLFDQAREIIPVLIPLSALKNQQLALFELNEELGYKHYFAAEFNLAEPYFLEALTYIDKSKKQTLSNLLNSIGVVYAQQAQLDLAAQYMLDSIKMLEDNGLTVRSDRYQNLGSLYFGLKDFDNSIVYSQKGLDIEPEMTSRRASLFSNMAAAQVEKGDYDPAIENLKRSIDINLKLQHSTAKARNNLGIIYNQRGEYAKALEQLNLSADELDDSVNSEMLGISLKSRADVYAAMKNYDQALALYEQAHQAFTEKDLKLKRVELYPKMLEVLEIKQDYQRSYEILKEFKTLNDEITNVESTQKVNEVMAAFEVEKNKQALMDSELARAQQQKSIDLLNHKNELEGRITTLMTIMVSALLLLLLFILRSWRFRGKVNHMLLDKNNRIENQHAELSTLNTQLKKQTEIDALTGLKNRRYITQLIAEESAKEQKAQKQWCLINIDIDDFKKINDSYGHQRGDEVLVQFARSLKQVKGKNDVVARWGGEEFLWLAEMKGSHNGSIQCESFQSILANQSWFRDHDDKITCSMGFSSFPLIDLNFEDWEAALRLADYALYQAKNAGKNRWMGFELVDPKIAYDDIKDVENLVNGNRLRVLNK
ncbi:diguanylate cyclase [Marinicella litoralis]|uniref:diguanylate cyclase n=1 Tax=Marinicella litoralis TaxID=644220 RepID=A0A4V3DI24_9GAMM|nr:diguanylate cyclase [Marinicella litoralis]TDR20461.1 diguanylate cyclase (GGDEF)-like protein [Marinicella litoralis]